MNVQNNSILYRNEDESECLGILIKYNSNGKVECAQRISNATKINSISMAKDGKIVIGTGDSVTKIIKLKVEIPAPEVTELNVNNKRKEFIISTDIISIRGEENGTITKGEKVKYGDDSKNSIEIIPNDGYEIIRLLINGKEQDFDPNIDGSYILPIFENVTENKNVLVEFAKPDNKITINKVDKNGNLLENAKFEIKSCGRF